MNTKKIRSYRQKKKEDRRRARHTAKQVVKSARSNTDTVTFSSWRTPKYFQPPLMDD